MKNKKTIRNIILGLFGAILLVAAYAFVNGNPDVPTDTGTLSSIVSSDTYGQIKETDTQLANADILRILGNIRTIQLEDEIFSNPVFGLLEDSRFRIPAPGPAGRPNPFLPIGFDFAIGTQFQNQTQTDTGLDNGQTDGSQNTDDGQEVSDIPQV